MGGAYLIRVLYFLDCLVLVPIAWKYRSVGPLIALSIVAIVFNPIYPLKTGSWMLWQFLNVFGLFTIGFSGLMIADKRKRLRKPFELAHIEWVMNHSDDQE